MEKIKAKGQSVQKTGNRRTDRGDCITSRANAVGNYVVESESDLPISDANGYHMASSEHAVTGFCVERTSCTGLE